MLDKKPLLLLLPNFLSEEALLETLPAILSRKIFDLDGIIAESEKEARRYLKHFTFKEGKTFRDIPIRVLNEHTPHQEVADLLNPIMQGQVFGVISDAGLPCIADPGARLVALAKQKGVMVEAISGPSSVFLALMLSGLSAQRFFFQGYLEREPIKLRSEIQMLEKESKQRKCTQVCIEAPYRSLSLFTTLLDVLEDNTKLSIACDLTSKSEISYTFSVRQWKKRTPPDLQKKPTVFLFSADE
ncbi:MAG: SAM-dependent methyltransferase [Verrucomicrobia bacterium]|nr:SAM-dependent methyltransferase [Verrucomicrobiota bacterium]